MKICLKKQFKLKNCLMCNHLALMPFLSFRSKNTHNQKPLMLKVACCVRYNFTCDHIKRVEIPFCCFPSLPAARNSVFH